MFNEVRQAVEKLEALCAKPGTGYEKGKPLVATEVYNEGWMLRLVVAKLCDTALSDLTLRDNSPQDEWISMLCAAAKEGWCSEGRVFPLFCGENSTCADGIVGNISLRKDKKWGFECNSGRFAILEAKMGSALSRGVKNDKSFDQAARNVACVAGMESGGATGYFFVFAPDDSKCRQQMQDVVSMAADSSIAHIEKEMPGHKLRKDFSEEKIKDRIRRMQNESRVGLITWESLLAALPADDFLNSFYDNAKRANGIVEN